MKMFPKFCKDEEQPQLQKLLTRSTYTNKRSHEAFNAMIEEDVDKWSSNLLSILDFSIIPHSKNWETVKNKSSNVNPNL